MSADVPRGACLQCEQVGQLSYVQGEQLCPRLTRIRCENVAG